MKLKDQLSKAVSDFAKIEKADKKENTELTEDYRRLTNKYKDLQAKFRHFETADTLKYNEVLLLSTRILGYKLALLYICINVMYASGSSILTMMVYR